MDKYIENYLKQFGSVSIIPASELNGVIKSAQSGNRAALNKIVYSFQKFIVHIAVRTGVLAYSYNSDFEPDIISAGNIGLLKAIKNFNCESGALFTAYADRCISGSIFDLLNKNHQIYYPMDVIKDINKITKVSKGKQVTKKNVAQIANKTGISEDRILKLSEVNYSFVSLYSKNKNTDEDYNICDDAELCSSNTADKLALKKEVSALVQKALDTLSEKEYIILSKHFGLDCEPMSFSEIGALLNLSKGRVGQICLNTLKRLRYQPEYTYLSGLAA